MTSFPHLAEPLQLRHLTLRNRIVFGAHTANMAEAGLPVVMATGSQPNVWSVEDVLSHQARPGQRVVLLDDTGDWRGGGTAWHLAERDHRVTIVTPHPLVGFFIQRTADALVMSTTIEPERSVIDDLVSSGGEMHVVGDALAARLAVHAIYDGRLTGMAL